MLALLEAKGILEDTWFVYTSDHGEMAGNHGLMSKCVLYEPAVRVPLIIRPPGGRSGRIVNGLVEHLDVPATLRDIGGGAPVPDSEGRSLLGYLAGSDPEAREVSVSENWGFAAFETDRYKLVVDEDAGTPCQLFDLSTDPAEDANLVSDPAAKEILDEMVESRVRPFFRTPPSRPTPSLFTP
jgi:choline-sulfatase